MSSLSETRLRLAQLPVPLRWVIAARLKTVGLSVTPVLCGAWIAALGGRANPVLTMLAAFSAMAIQIGTNLWNDAADAQSGTDTSERLGPPRMTALGLLEAHSVKRAALMVFAVALAAGLPLVAAGGWPIIAIGLVSLLLGYCYSMGPLPLSHTPLGELIVIAFFGVIAVMGTAHVLGAEPSLLGALAGLMLGLPSSAVLLLNNHRDRKTDYSAGRRTLAILAGDRGAKLLYALLMGSALALLAILLPPGKLSWLAAIPALGAAALVRGLWQTPVSAALNRFLPLTVFFQFALLLTLVAAAAFA